MKLTIVRGLPGSGKSTYAKKNFNCLILENDMFQISDSKYSWTHEGTKRAISLVMEIAESALSNGSDVCVANTFTKKRFIEAYRRLAEKYNADFEVLRAAGEYENVHNVPSDVLENMKSSFEDWEGEKFV